MKSWTIGKRITLGFSVLILCIVVLGVTSWFEAGKISSDMTSLTKDNTQVRMTAELVIETLQYRIVNLKHVVTTDAADMSALDKKADD